MNESLKVRSDLIASMLGLVIFSIFGMSVNILIGKLYDSEILGIFSQAFTVYIIASQIACWGLQFSSQALSSSATAPNHKIEIINTAFVMVVPIAFGFSSLVFLLSGLVTHLMKSANLEANLRIVSISLFFYAINKVISGSFNGLRLIKMFSVLQALRGVFLVVSLLIFYHLSISGYFIAKIVLWTEMGLFFFGLISLVAHGLFKPHQFSFSYANEHFFFGMKSMLSGVIIELNTRVDILLLGFFLADNLIGIYALAASLAEGFLLILSVFRSNFNPILAEHLFKDDKTFLIDFIKVWKIRVLMIMGGLFIVSIPLYDLIVHILGKGNWRSSLLYFVILSIGPLTISKNFPFLGALLQYKKPGWMTWISAVSIVINIVLNVLFIPLWGLTGAAIATSLALIISTFYAVYLTNSKIDYRLI